jgi:pimeloyl-ACP methyl ester carboxylesterase
MFEFLKRTKAPAPTTAPQQQGGQQANALRGQPMEEQERALRPQPEQRGNDKDRARQQKVMGKAHEIGNQDVVLEQLAHRGANKAIPGDLLKQWGYREAGAVADPESGFRSVLFMPTAEALSGQSEEGQIARMIHGGPPPPVLAFRGTQEKRGMQDDTNREGIGTYQFESNAGRIAQMFGAAGGKAVVAGHSLGGALAQLAASRFPGLVSRVVTFQAPAVSAEAAEKVNQHNATSAPEDKISSTHYRASGDLVHTAGEKLTKGDVYTFESKGIGNPMDHLQFPLARLAAARGSMIPGVTDQGKEAKDKLLNVKKTDSDKEKSGLMPRLAEGGRKLLGGVVRDESMEKYVQVWRDVEMMCRSGQFTESYVMGVIAANKELKPIQKDKMKNQVQILYAELPRGAQQQGEDAQQGRQQAP